MSWTPFTGTQTPVARKDHDCSWCVEVIPSGEQYVRWSGVDGDDGVITMKVHADCLEPSREAARFLQRHGAYPDESWCMEPHQRGRRCAECDDLPVTSTSGTENERETRN